MSVKKPEVSMDDECLCSGDSCSENTLFKPKMDLSCLACMKSELSCCSMSKTACCIFPAHPAFNGVAQGRDDVICVGQGVGALVKPLCVTGEKPLCKAAGKGLCCSQRCAYPCDQDIVSGCSCCFIRCCKCAPFKFGVEPCVKKDNLDESAFGGFGAEYAEAKYDTQYILAACCCVICSIYNPDTYVDAFGYEVKNVCLCGECDGKSSLLPKNASGYDILIDNVGSCLCVKPKTLCKGTSRAMFTLTKCALPCDDEVPFAVACFGIKCIGNPPEGFKQPAFVDYLFKPIAEGHDKAAGAAPTADEIER